MDNLLAQSFELMLYGLSGVFVLIALFFIMIKIITNVFKDKNK